MHNATTVADRAAPSLDHVCPTRKPPQPWLRHATQLITRNAHIAISGAHRTPPQPWLSHSALSPPQQWLICITLPAGHSHSAQRAPWTPLPWRSQKLAGLSVSGVLADLVRAGIALDDGHACSRVITGLDTPLPLANGNIGILPGGLVLRMTVHRTLVDA